MAILAAMLLVGINETGYLRSQDAVDQMAQAQSTRGSVNELLQNMVDAETGQRGYLLTGNESYLEPYDKAVTTVQAHMNALRSEFNGAEAEVREFTLLSWLVSRKLAEMELSLRLRRQGNEDAWKFILNTDVGKEHMAGIRKQAQTLIARNDQRLQAGRAQIEQSLILSRIGIATVAAIGLLAFYMYLRQVHAVQVLSQREQALLERERDRLEVLVRERTATLSELANHLQQVRENERGYLARELHDELGALLTAAKLDVARLKSKIDITVPDIADRLKHLTETLNSGIALKRRIIEDLRPSSLSNLGLTAALEIQAREYSERSGIEVETSLDTVELSEPTQLTVYRMVQEALTNISKYAEAKKVLVTVQAHPRHVLVEVRDDGQGFDLASVRPASHGLTGMRHRVESAGGRLTVSSEPGTGTLLSAVLPSQIKPGIDPKAVAGTH